MALPVFLMALASVFGKAAAVGTATKIAAGAVAAKGAGAAVGGGLLAGGGATSGALSFKGGLAALGQKGLAKGTLAGAEAGAGALPIPSSAGGGGSPVAQAQAAPWAQNMGQQPLRLDTSVSKTPVGGRPGGSHDLGQRYESYLSDFGRSKPNVNIESAPAPAPARGDISRYQQVAQLGGGGDSEQVQEAHRRQQQAEDEAARRRMLADPDQQNQVRQNDETPPADKPWYKRPNVAGFLGAMDSLASGGNIWGAIGEFGKAKEGAAGAGSWKDYLLSQMSKAKPGTQRGDDVRESLYTGAALPGQGTRNPITPTMRAKNSEIGSYWKGLQKMDPGKLRKMLTRGRQGRRAASTQAYKDAMRRRTDESQGEYDERMAWLEGAIAPAAPGRSIYDELGGN